MVEGGAVAVADRTSTRLLLRPARSTPDETFGKKIGRDVPTAATKGAEFWKGQRLLFTFPLTQHVWYKIKKGAVAEPFGMRATREK